MNRDLSSNKLPSFSQSKVLVVGDIILDHYMFGESNRISPEAPVPITNITKEEFRLGGAANVALNIKSLGSDCTLLGHASFDNYSLEIIKLLKYHKISNSLIRLKHLKTNVKIRILSQNQQINRADFDFKFSFKNDKNLQTRFEKLLKNHKVIIFSDYGKGTLENIEKLIKLALKKKCKILIDPKGKNYKKYSKVFLISPNYKEFVEIVGYCKNENQILKKGKILLNKLRVENLLITRGKEGMTLISKNNKTVDLKTEAKQVYDVTGAGDTVIATLGVCISADLDIIESINIANIAAGTIVSKIGTTPININELQKNYRIKKNFVSKFYSLNDFINLKKIENFKLVMTNGCFDILHSGHIKFLNEAKLYGEKLLVAINSDESIKRIKGQDRPINKLIDRIYLLSSLECVDFIISFDSNTPINLIKKINPNVLVKGGDYKPHQIIGFKYIKKIKGEVKTLKYNKGFSTTNIIDRIKKSK